jgi:hypothetical protein
VQVLETYQTLSADGDLLEIRFGYESVSKRDKQQIAWKSFSSTVIRGDQWATREYTIARPARFGSASPGPQLVVESHSAYVREREGRRRRRKLRHRLPPVQPVWESEEPQLRPGPVAAAVDRRTVVDSSRAVPALKCAVGM